MILELIEDIAKLALIVACLYFVLGAYVRGNQPSWSEPLEKRRWSYVISNAVHQAPASSGGRA